MNDKNEDDLWDDLLLVAAGGFVVGLIQGLIFGLWAFTP